MEGQCALARGEKHQEEREQGGNLEKLFSNNPVICKGNGGDEERERAVPRHENWRMPRRRHASAVQQSARACIVSTSFRSPSSPFSCPFGLPLFLSILHLSLVPFSRRRRRRWRRVTPSLSHSNMPDTRSRGLWPGARERERERASSRWMHDGERREKAKGNAAGGTHTHVYILIHRRRASWLLAAPARSAPASHSLARFLALALVF